MIDLANTVSAYQKDAVEKWEVTVKERMNQNRIEKVLKNLQSAGNMAGKTDENSIKYSIRDVRKTNNITVTYSVVIPKSKQYQAEVIMVISGRKWDKTTEKNYKKILHQATGRYFTETSQIFACLVTSPDAIIEVERFLKYLTETIGFERQKTQIDKISYSRIQKNIYGYTPLWNQKLDMNMQSVNVQIAQVQASNKKTQLVIGTPILINEY
ncbi:YwmB family TATA-box binding protein [Virgibacillus sp. 179-BFC.A HS]|uniref:YwmB family TATA-box binding protein n=1 Tax=Tigheibacillus jepli TaxID=3035914 RepID=A0ABU5CG66_9BACI|nr:YwmB family TATA-box binding protein [Virgibacillus sp. 179-BFC.A HS]MDY0404573.1 YwmB family TATA-box binding protein [Virgibacillus sp. 179-BFC.A HS]